MTDVLLEEEKSGHRNVSMEGRCCDNAVRTPCDHEDVTPRREVRNGSLPHGPRKEPTLPTSWCQIYDLHDNEYKLCKAPHLWYLVMTALANKDGFSSSAQRVSWLAAAWSPPWTPRVDANGRRAFGSVFVERLPTEGFGKLGTDHGIMLALGRGQW